MEQHSRELPDVLTVVLKHSCTNMYNGSFLEYDKLKITYYRSHPYGRFLASFSNLKFIVLSDGDPYKKYRTSVSDECKPFCTFNFVPQTNIPHY